MPRQARKESGTGIYHVMLRGINRQDIFEDAEAKYDDWPCFFGNNEVEINCVDFCHDSAKQASLMALTAPKIENFGNF